MFTTTVGVPAFHAAVPPTVRIMDEEYEPADEVRAESRVRGRVPHFHRYTAFHIFFVAVPVLPVPDIKYAISDSGISRCSKRASFILCSVLRCSF